VSTPVPLVLEQNFVQAASGILLGEVHYEATETLVTIVTIYSTPRLFAFISEFFTADNAEWQL
jgi:hypothetical protein